MNKTIVSVLEDASGEGEEILSLSELCRACGVDAEYVLDLVEEGVIEPLGRGLSEWRFTGTCLYRARVAARLQRDLHVNLSGAALALNLLEEIETLRGRLDARYGEQFFLLQQ